MKMNRSIRKMIRFKLIIMSLVLLIFSVIIIFMFYKQQTRRLVLDERTNYDQNSFYQLERHIESYIELIDKNINELMSNELMVEIGQEKFNGNLMTIKKYNEALDQRLGYNIYQQPYVENVIVLYNNNYIYGSKRDQQGGFYGDDITFNQLISNLSSEHGKDFLEKPVYQSAQYKTTYDEDFKAIYQLMNDKVLYCYEEYDDSKMLRAVIIVCIDPSFIAEPYNNDNEDGYWAILDEQTSQTVWQSMETPDNIHNDDSILLEHKLFIEGWKVIRYVPQDDINLFQNRFIIIIFFFSFVIIIGMTVHLSKVATKPIYDLADEVTTISKEVNKSKIHKKGVWQLPSFRTRLIYYFSITSLVPCLVFLSIIYIIASENYESEIITIAQYKNDYILDSLDYVLANLDEETRYLCYSETIQNLYQDKMDLAKRRIDILDTHKLNNAKYSAIFYDADGKYIWSLGKSEYQFAAYKAEDINLLNENMGRLVYLGSKNRNALKPIQYFGRAIRDLYNPLNSEYIGHAFFEIDEEVLRKIFWEMNYETKTFSFIIDDVGEIFGNNRDQLINEVISNKHFEEMKVLKNNNVFSIILENGEEYKCIYNQTKQYPFSVVTVVSEKGINEKLAILGMWSGVFVIAFIFIVVILINTFVWIIVKPLHEMIDNIEELLNNEEIEFGVSYQKADEIQYLTNKFNNLVYRLNVMMKKNIEVNKNASKQVILQKEAQINALQQQINPHFLYNTLEMIKWMAYKKNAIEVCDVISALGEFFRGTVSNQNMFISLSEELEHLKNYLFIQEIRYNGKLQIVENIQEEILSTKVIKLILQPLVENAIIHGLKNMINDSEIEIIGLDKGDKIELIVSDNGVGMTKDKQIEVLWAIKEKHADISSSIGIMNVYNRLSLYYGDQFNFELISEIGEGTIVKLTLPKIH